MQGWIDVPQGSLLAGFVTDTFSDYASYGALNPTVVIDRIAFVFASELYVIGVRSIALAAACLLEEQGSPYRLDTSMQLCQHDCMREGDRYPAFAYIRMCAHVCQWIDWPHLLTHRIPCRHAWAFSCSAASGTVDSARPAATIHAEPT